MKYRLSTTALALSLGMAMATGAQAAVVEFSDRSSFDAAMTANVTIDFENLEGFRQPDPLTIDGVDFISSDNSGLFNSTGFGLPGTFLAAQNFGSMIMEFSAGTSAVGFDFASLNRSAVATFDVFSGMTLLGSFSRDAIDNTFAFFGVTSSDADITSITFTHSDSEFETVDNVTVGVVGDVAPIPLPATGWMILAGLGGLAAMRRRG